MKNKIPKFISILHSDGVTIVKAKLYFYENTGFFCEYKFKDKGEKKPMHYSITLNEGQCIGYDC